MKEEFSEIYKSINLLLKNEFSIHLKENLNSHLIFIENIEKALISFKEEIVSLNCKSGTKESYKLLSRYHDKLLRYIESIYNNLDKINFDDDFYSYSKELADFILTVDELKIIVQSDERFKKIEGDNLYIVIGKQIKSIGYSFSKTPRFTSNIFRKIFNKDIHPYKKWVQTVQLRNLIYYWLRDELSFSLFHLIINIKKNISISSHKIFLSFKEIENISNEYFFENKENGTDELILVLETAIETLNFEKENIKQIEKTIDGEVNEKQKIIINDFENEFYKSGTIELPSGKRNDKVISKKHKKLNEIYSDSFEGWSNTLFGLYDQWRLNEEILILKYNVLKEFIQTKEKTIKRINNNINPQISLIKEILEKSCEKIKNFNGNNDEFISFINKEREYVSKTIGEKLSLFAIETLFAEDLPSVIDDIEQEYRLEIETISSKRSIIKGNNYGREVKRSELESFNPKELIEKELIHKFAAEIKRIKIKINQQIQLIHNDLSEIDQVAEFNLEAAIASAEKNNIKYGEEKLSITIAIEGLGRAITKVEDIEENAQNISSLINNDLGISVFSFVKSLQDLTESEKVFQMKIRIAKAIAQERAENIKDKILRFIKSIFPSIVNGWNNLSIESSKTYFNIKKRLGIYHKVEILTSEISDYLAETRSAIEKLPFVYQRLFRNEALTDERFFVERSKELQVLTTAYENWKQERYSSVVIHGEKGAGSTTIINFYLSRNNPEYGIIRHVQLETISNADDLIKFFEKLFGLNNILSVDDLILKISSFEQKKIVILENLQNFFLRTVSGFGPLEAIFSIISKTNKKIFWITTCTIYAWGYFQKTLGIADYFGYDIKLESLKDDEINNVILKRHRVSGFNLVFQPSENDSNSKAFKKMNDEQKQIFLKKKYFTMLNKIVLSNITLAQLFWLRSTIKVIDNTIYISSLRDLDFSFMKSLSDDKIFTLYSLLLHEGMSEADHLCVFNQTVSKSKLTTISLIDDGIVLEEGDIFYVNPLLYRHTVNLLKSKNIIH